MAALFFIMGIIMIGHSKRMTVFSIILATVILFITSGCGRKGNRKSGYKVTSDDPDTLTVYAWDQSFNVPALKAAEKAYKEKDPKFKLKIVLQADSSDVENAVTSAGLSHDFSSLPDIVLFQDHYIQRFIEEFPGAFESIDNTGIEWDNFSRDKVSMSLKDGVHYGIPVDNGTVIMAYRTDYLEAAGHSISEMDGISWSDFIKVARDVKAHTGKCMLSVNQSGNPMPFIMMQAEGKSFFSNGKPAFTDNDKASEVMSVIVTMEKDGTLMLLDSQNRYDRSISSDDVAAVMDGNWVLSKIRKNENAKGKWAILPLPTLSGKRGYAATGGSSLYITSNCHNKRLANDFLKYTFGGGKGAMETYSHALTEGGLISTYFPAIELDAYKKTDDFFGGDAIYSKILSYSAKVEPVDESSFYYSARSYLNDAIRSVIEGNSMHTALLEAQNKLTYLMEN